MDEGRGSQQLVRIATAYLASFAFAVTFLVATLTGNDGLTALIRGVIAVLVASVAGQLLVPPVVDVVFAAMARDEARREAEQAAEDEP